MVWRVEVCVTSIYMVEALSQVEAEDEAIAMAISRTRPEIVINSHATATQEETESQ